MLNAVCANYCPPATPQVVQCPEYCFVEAFIPKLAIESFDEPVLLGLSGSGRTGGVLPS